MSTLFPQRWLTGFVITSLVICYMRPSAAENILVFAATSLALPLQKISDEYSKSSGDNIRISLASSSTLARQIDSGAPADIFISANDIWMDYLSKRYPSINQSKRRLLTNRLAIVAPANSNINHGPLDTRLLNTILKDGRLAIGDPDHVPVGIYAMEALKSLSLWQLASSRTARANNARAVLNLVEKAAIPAGIVYQSDVQGNQRIKLISLIPVNAHAPIHYWVALTPNHKPSSSQFLEYLFAANAKDVFKRHGFLVK